MDIIFYNHWHNGDVFLVEPMIRSLIKKIKNDSEFDEEKNFNFYFSHKCKEIVWSNKYTFIPIKDLTHHPKQRECVYIHQDKVYINTWYCQKFAVACGEVSLKNLKSISKNIIDRLHALKIIKEKFELRTHDFIQNIPRLETVGQCDYRDHVMKLIGGKRPVLVCNNKVLSNQCDNIDFDEILKQVPNKNNIVYLITNKTKVVRPDFVYLYDCKQTYLQDDSDLPVISWLSYYTDLIIGSGSGPYEVCKTKENLFNETKDPKKVFICNSSRPWDVLWYTNNPEEAEFCRGLWTKNNKELFKETIISEINKLNE